MESTDSISDHVAAIRRGRPPGNKAKAAEPPVRAASMERSEEEPLRRRKPQSEGDKNFFIPDELLAELDARGLSANWKRLSVYGKEEGASHFMDIEDAGWRPLSLKSFPRFAKLMPTNWTSDTLDRGGQRLYVRPKSFTQEAEAENLDAARDAVDAQKEKISGSRRGEFERGGRADIDPIVRRGKAEKLDKSEYNFGEGRGSRRQMAVDE